MFRIDGKIALVTGGSRGIGRACAEALAEQGATVVVNYVKGEAAAKEVAEGILAKGGKADVAGFDVANTAQTETALDGIIKKHGKIDVLVANAGIAVDNLLLRLKDEELQRLFDTNVKGALTCARVAMKSMMRSKNGRIVFMSSVIGEMGNVGQTAYSITKAALLGATKSIAREYASRNVTVNAVAPGFIDTEMTSSMNDAMKSAVLQMIPLARTGTAREIAAAVCYLASDEAAYVTGQVLRVNGGMYV
ncbi:MAG TPA: 3-oxoacyl-ACP reductase family protein [Polyangiaceae bacterium]|jgi:3-oxoacyl-[acyl-carrier protein] reductase|nr:3-oxoacyl-ACP reductase family protein [Polyangiaceae bacterium]